MHITSTFNTAIASMLANKVRTALTVLGIVIGIASVIIVFSAGKGIEGLVLGQIESYGTDIIATEVRLPSNKKGTAKDTESGVSMVQGIQVTTMTLDDMEDINRLSNVKAGYANIMSQDKVVYQNESKKAYIFGTNATYIDIDKSEMQAGRFFTDMEDKSLATVVVLGSKIKEELFGESDPIGKSVKFHKKKFRVIGVMKERGAIFGVDYDEFIYVPIKTLQKKILGVDYVTYMVHQLYDLSLAEDTAEEMRYILRENHDIAQPEDLSDNRKDDFRVTTMTEMMDMLSIVTDAMTWLLLAIVAISLVVGGVGIMNIMYVIVSERTSEIGLRKAVGANTSNIMWQFLIESTLITLFAGIAGIAVGVGVSYLIAKVANAQNFDWHFIIPLQAYITAIIFSIFFGIAFGLYPARKAAKMDPIMALRKE